MVKPYPQSGFGHAIISDVNNHKVRPMALLERWLITGGKDSLFNTLPVGYAEHATLSSTTPVVQLFLLQLTLGIFGAYLQQPRPFSCSYYDSVTTEPTRKRTAIIMGRNPGNGFTYY